MPIKGVTDSQRLVFGGTIRTGIMVDMGNGKSRPQNVEHFVLTDAPGVAEVYGDTPHELHVMFPSDDLEQVCSQWLMSYTSSKLRCKGNGEVANYKGEDSPEGITDHEGDVKGTRQRVCKYKDCPDFASKRCSEVMRLRFVLPRVDVFRVFNLPTTAVTAMVPFIQKLEMTKNAFGTLRNTMFILRKVKKSFTVKNNKTNQDMKVENWTLELEHDATFADKYGKEVMEKLAKLGSGGNIFHTKQLGSAIPLTALPTLGEDTPPVGLIPEENMVDAPDPVKLMLDDPKVQELFQKVAEKLNQPNTVGKQEATAARYKTREELVTYLEGKLV